MLGGIHGSENQMLAEHQRVQEMLGGIHGSENQMLAEHQRVQEMLGGIHGSENQMLAAHQRVQEMLGGIHGSENQMLAEHQRVQEMLGGIHGSENQKLVENHVNGIDLRLIREMLEGIHGSENQKLAEEHMNRNNPKIVQDVLDSKYGPPGTLPDTVRSYPLTDEEKGRIEEKKSALKPYSEEKVVIDRGFGTGALTALSAIGPQERYMFGGYSKWIPHIEHHKPFSITQRNSIKLPGTNGYFGNTCEIQLKPRECGDMLSNMYLSCTIPSNPAGTPYTELLGRAILEKVEFLVDGVVFESINDDWYIIRDQLFLDADEKLGMYKTLGGYPEETDTPASGAKLIVPLEFFFCRRFTHGKMDDRPYLPLFAMSMSDVRVRITFNSRSWVNTSLADSIDIVNPVIIIEEIHMSLTEKEEYMNNTQEFIIPRVWKEATQEYKNGTAVINLTAAFPVSMMVWFVRNKLFETQNSLYAPTRYTYGYTSQYLQASVPATFFNNVELKYIDTIENATIFIENRNILSNFPGGLYYTFKQAIDHGLSVPTKNMYMYCFSENPREYSQDGAFDFSKVNSKTTFLNIKFSPQYAAQIEADFDLNLYYYGYVTVKIAGGRATLSV
jgi:hypothetical protein